VDTKDLKDNGTPVETKPCGVKCEVWSRVVGYFRPISDWNKGKQHEFVQRRLFRVDGTTPDRVPSAPGADKPR